MKHVKYIENFIFDFAQYYISDKNKKSVLLKINYAKNIYKIVGISNETDHLFLNEIKEIAEGLLKRKHGVNRAADIEIS